MYSKLTAPLAVGSIYGTITSVVIRGWSKSSLIQCRRGTNFNYRIQLVKLRHRIQYSYVCSISQLCTGNLLLNRASFTLREQKKLFTLTWRGITVQPRFKKISKQNKKTNKQTHVARIATIPQATYENFF